MSEKKAYLTLSPISPDLNDLDDLRACDYVHENVKFDDIAAMMRDIQKLGGGEYKAWAKSLGLVPGHQPTETMKESAYEKIRATMEKWALEVFRDLIPLVAEDTLDMTIEYDPSEWFATERSRWGTYPAGRLYSLAHVGALEALGCRVEGTGLPTVESAE